MAGMLAEHEAAYVLHRRPFKETSLIVDAFSLSHGRVALLVKGALRSKKSLGADLQVFRPLLLSWSGRTELKTLNAMEVPSSGFSFQGINLYCAYYLNELLLNLCPVEEALPAVFSAYASALNDLRTEGPIINSDKDNSPELILRIFEYRLLAALGLAPDLSVDCNGRNLAPDICYRLSSDGEWVPQNSPIDRTTGASCTGQALKTVSRLIAEPVSQTEHPGQGLSIEHLRELKTLMRQLVDQSLNGRSLKSRDMIRQWVSMRARVSG